MKEAYIYYKENLLQVIEIDDIKLSNTDMIWNIIFKDKTVALIPLDYLIIIKKK